MEKIPKRNEKLDNDGLEIIKDKIEQQGESIGRDFFKTYIIQLIQSRELVEERTITEDNIDDMVDEVYEEDELWNNLDSFLYDIIDNHSMESEE